jgi:hypothetical protein
VEANLNMTDDQKSDSTPPKDFKELKEQINKKKKGDTKEVIKQIATRDKLERDYKEDLLSVSFYSSPETRRMIKAKRPTQKQMMTIMRLSAEAAIYEGRMDPDSLSKMVDIYDKLPELADEICVDKSLDKDFWTDGVSFATLQNFITEVIKETQKGSGIESEELKNFR